MRCVRGALCKHAGRLMHMASAFCAAFALLGVKLLFWSSQPVSFGSVLLTACVSMAVAQLFTGMDIMGTLNMNSYLTSIVNHTCANAPFGGPVSIACMMSGATQAS